jgi:collagenase-like PrtC family protease
MTMRGTLTLGPVLFNWQAERWRDFYLAIADEAPVETVYLGEAVCSKRAPFFAPYLDEVVERLTAAGKQVVFSTLAEVTVKVDRRLVDGICSLPDVLVEANDASALWRLSGRPHFVGPFVNVYNEDTLALLAEKGAKNVCLPVELPSSTIQVLAAAAKSLGVGLETQVFGRMPLALSARCYHARAHGLTKDSCQFVCEQDPDGLDLTTLEGKPFLAVNGIQTMSHDYLDLLEELDDLRQMGIGSFRLSPHTCDMSKVAEIFRRRLDGKTGAEEARQELAEVLPQAAFSNGFFHAKPGHQRVRRPDA